MAIEDQIQGAYERLHLTSEDDSITFIETPSRFLKQKLTNKTEPCQNQVFNVNLYISRIKNLLKLRKAESKSPHRAYQVCADTSSHLKGSSDVILKKYSSKTLLRELFMLSLTLPRFNKLFAFCSLVILWALPIVLMSILLKMWPLVDYRDYVLCAIAFPTTFFIYYPNFQYLMMGVLDYRRKSFLMRCTTKLLTCCDDSEISKLIPSMNLLRPSNLFNWLKIRMVALQTGARFTARIFAYLGWLLLVSTSMFALLILQYFKIIDLRLTPLSYAYACFYIMWVYSTSLVMLHLAAIVNSYFTQHLNILENYKFQLSVAMVSDKFRATQIKENDSLFLKQLKLMISIEEPQTEEKARKELHKVYKTLGQVIKRVRHQENYHSLKVLGTPVTPGVISTVWGFLLSLVIAFISSNFELNA